MSGRSAGVQQPRDNSAGTGGSGRAFRGLVLVFVLSFVNLLGLLVTVMALGGTAPWSRWQFVGAFGVIEAAAGLANVISPNLWRLPVAQLQTSAHTDVGLAASALLLPHWGGLARCFAGLVCIAIAGWHEGVGPASLELVPVLVALAWVVLAISALAARAGVAKPDVDVVQLVVRWRRRERELRPLSIGASVVQFLLSIATIPAVKLLPPSVLYRPELAPSPATLLVALALSAALALLVYLSWSGRVAARAPAEQQREAEEHA
jgi:hypothetical protein